MTARTQNDTGWELYFRGNGAETVRGDLLIHPELEVGYALGDPVQNRFDLHEILILIRADLSVLRNLQQAVFDPVHLVDRVEGFHGDLGQLLGLCPDRVRFADGALVAAVVIQQRWGTASEPRNAIDCRGRYSAYE